MIPLTKLQTDIMKEFYSLPQTPVVFNKTVRNSLWNQAKSRSKSLDLEILAIKCPALAHQIQKSFTTGKNIQSAVFSECVYAQTFANMMQLNVFVNCMNDTNYIPDSIKNLLSSYRLYPRYVYGNDTKSRMLIQAGGCNGIDSALITVFDLNIFTIEFKEPGAKTCEPDLPKYLEDGKLRITEEFLERYPQFAEMLNEQEELNFFEVMGSNINNFSAHSVNIAVSNNYTKKYADVICTEDTKGNLVMLPANQVSIWAKLEGEIRPAGRNHYNVWTPKALENFLLKKGAVVNNGRVKIDISQLVGRKERGGNSKISGYKINNLFFIYANDCVVNDKFVMFTIDKVQQLNPTIAGKMFFKTLDYTRVKQYYLQYLG
ncbi:MAG: hypothetical protein NC133_01900 [Prevotella sp.]|nr:hypothetical protein [Prevotella sp.]